MNLNNHASELANVLHKQAPEASRGAIPYLQRGQVIVFERIDEHGQANEGQERTVALLREYLDFSGMEEVEFGQSDGGDVWVMIVRPGTPRPAGFVDDASDEEDRRWDNLLQAVRLNLVVCAAWRSVCGDPGAWPPPPDPTYRGMQTITSMMASGKLLESELDSQPSPLAV